MVDLNDRLRLLPDEPGVYLMKDTGGTILYVGKAASLKRRVRSYFQAARHLDPKTRRLVGEISDFEVIVTASEREALILEDALIKKHQPRFNVRLRDDKRYPYLKLTAERYPRLVVTRELEGDVQSGARYFGPYTAAYAIREARRTIQKLFRIRTCSLDIGDQPVRTRPCLDHYIGLCDAPCLGAIDPEEYGKLVDEAALFLRGQHHELLPELRGEMATAAERLEFERAARLRDRLQALERLMNAKRVVSAKGADRDAIGLHQEYGRCAVQVFFVRGGKLVGRDRLTVETADSDDPCEILAAFVKQYYAQAPSIPKEILLPHDIEEAERQLIETWLGERRGSRVDVGHPRRGPKARLVETAVRNARLALLEEQAQSLARSGRDAQALDELQELCKLETPPRRIEGFDISTIQGAEPVAAMVVFHEGTSVTSQYRRFKIKATEGSDDVAMMVETVRRRLERAIAGDERFLPFPDLILIDGGKGHLSAVRRAMRELGLGELPTLALAKEHEHLYVEGRSTPLLLPWESPALQLLQRVRDEAHRSALSYHRRLRGKRTLGSLLDEIPGVGPARKRALMERFGSLKRLREATPEELVEVPGLPPKVARRIHRALNAPPSQEG